MSTGDEDSSEYVFPKESEDTSWEEMAANIDTAYIDPPSHLSFFYSKYI